MLTFVFVVLAASVIGFVYSSHQRRKNKYPPGPPPSGFITGHMRDVPAKKPWLTYTEWGKTYGDIIHLQVLGEHIIILNSVGTANDLLDKQSRIYSDRPYWQVCKVSGWHLNLGLQPYSDMWRSNRRIYQQNLRPEATSRLIPLVKQTVDVLLTNLHDNPKTFMHHIEAFSGGLTLATMYGIKVTSSDEPLLSLGKKATATLETLMSPPVIAGLTLFPNISSFPGWIPILGPMKRLINDAKLYLHDLREEPFNYVMKNMDSEKEKDCIVGRMMHQLMAEGKLAESVELVDQIKDMACTSFAASVDTMFGAISTFVLAMARNPEYQFKAQKEMDDVIGRGRLPSLNDRKNLMYTEAVFREVFRYRPPLPLGVGHKTVDEDVYNDYYIPKGAIVLSNVWAMTRDERKYIDPDTFNPERFFDVDGKLNNDDTILAFGFGRRICVGRHLADAAVWLAITSILACFNIGKQKDEQDNEIEIPENYSDGPGTFSYPLPFSCSITPRYEGAESLFINPL